MIHLAVCQADLVDATANQQVTAVNDLLLLVEDGNFILPANAWLVAVHAMQEVCTGVRLNVGRLREVAFPQISPFTVGVLPGSRPAMDDLRERPLPIVRDQQIQVELSMGTATDEDAYVGLWLKWTNQAPQIPQEYYDWERFFRIGEDSETNQLFGGTIQPINARNTPGVTGSNIIRNSWKIRATGTATLTVDAWTPVPLTFVDRLPPGKYAVIGMQAISATCVYARLVFPGYTWRPGCLGQATETELPHPMFMRGGMGLYGVFSTTRPPQAEFFATAADTAETVILEIVPLELLDGMGF